jgi:hypothetical protein
MFLATVARGLIRTVARKWSMPDHRYEDSSEVLELSRINPEMLGFLKILWLTETGIIDASVWRHEHHPDVTLTLRERDPGLKHPGLVPRLLGPRVSRNLLLLQCIARSDPMMKS